ncbi:MAG TPA: hypothetical protein VKA67_12890, partial [Verrucomicrobiae bacterium]|nr:hypothetical protein [Verrucomicrobiae bacterium]
GIIYFLRFEKNTSCAKISLPKKGGWVGLIIVSLLVAPIMGHFLKTVRVIKRLQGEGGGVYWRPNILSGRQRPSSLLRARPGF